MLDALKGDGDPAAGCAEDDGVVDDTVEVLHFEGEHGEQHDECNGEDDRITEKFFHALTVAQAAAAARCTGEAPGKNMLKYIHILQVLAMINLI